MFRKKHTCVCHRHCPCIELYHKISWTRKFHQLSRYPLNFLLIWLKHQIYSSCCHIRSKDKLKLAVTEEFCSFRSLMAGARNFATCFLIFKRFPRVSRSETSSPEMYHHLLQRGLTDVFLSRITSIISRCAPESHRVRLQLKGLLLRNTRLTQHRYVTWYFFYLIKKRLMSSPKL